ncbi:UbiA prenyltransferase family protein [Pontibacter sp. G13]|uniref:UbiA prenyltransferase family protein n=1 Tax=Pontibacter sp. G13 TaxID=3074898 RepID=UPI00288B9AA0|nr:UbiA prenyltransferase family protein [Pontibacter sp. G13]WNJ16164.1 UbiA prenyltransferase family protein [Pontibacter sp. G13]
MWKDLILLIRPRQLIKQGVILLPAFFAGRLFEPNAWWRLLIAWVCFGMVAGAVYILNDLYDQEADRLHPTKRFRPIASGRVSSWVALVSLGLLILISIPCAWLLDHEASYWMMAYLLINVGYSRYLKHVPIVDLMVIGSGFLIRLAVGSEVLEPIVPLSKWILVLVFLGALFLGLAKRRDDVLLGQQGGYTRSSVEGYTLPLVDTGLGILAAVILVVYLGYTLSPEVEARMQSQQVWTTSLFVLFGLFRYLHSAFVRQSTGNPVQVITSDIWLQMAILGWMAMYGWFLYG